MRARHLARDRRRSSRSARRSPTPAEAAASCSSTTAPVPMSASRRRCRREHQVDVETDPARGAVPRRRGRLRPADRRRSACENFDGLRLCSQVRSLERTRHLPILAIADADDNARLLRGLEIGVNDYLIRPIDQNELLARVRTQIRRKRYTDQLRDNVQTLDRDGDHRRADRACTTAATWRAISPTLVEQAAARGRPLSLIDPRHRLLQVDQRHLRPRRRRRRAARIRAAHPQKSIRGIDLACRYGGEEFVVVMPDTDVAVAGHGGRAAAPRIAAEPFPIEKGAKRIDVTDLDRAVDAGEEGRAGRRRAEARRPRALSRQARRPQPRRRRGGVGFTPCLVSTVAVASIATCRYPAKCSAAAPVRRSFRGSHAAVALRIPGRPLARAMTFVLLALACKRKTGPRGPVVDPPANLRLT